MRWPPIPATNECDYYRTKRTAVLALEEAYDDASPSSSTERSTPTHGQHRCPATRDAPSFCTACPSSRTRTVASLLSAEDFARVNPNTGTAPIFRSRRDAELTTAIYGRLPVLVDRSSGEEVKAWPVKYTRMFDMTNDSGLFRTRAELEEKEGAWPVGGNRYDSRSGEWVPLYVGRMIHQFDHRAASITVNPANVHRPAQPEPASLEQHRNLNWLPEPQYWVLASGCAGSPQLGWVLGFKEITAPTNMRTFIAAILPAVGFSNKVPVLKPETQDRNEWLLAANLNATVFDFATRQKIQGQTLNLFILEQLPVVPPERYEAVRFGSKTAAEIRARGGAGAHLYGA